MKKLVLFIGVFLSSFLLFAANPNYEILLKKAKNYEANGQYMYALCTYYDAMEVEQTINAKEAYLNYKKLADSIIQGNPGSRKFDTFEKYDGWIKLVTEYEKYWTENCPYVITLGKLIQFDANYQNRTVTYGINVSYDNSIKYQIISDIIKTGFENSYRSEWTKIPENWPTESVFINNNGNYFRDGVALVNIGGKNYPAALVAIGEEEQLFYDIKFIVTDLEGNKLLESGRKLVGSQGAVLFKNVYEITMKKIESGNIKIVPTGIYLEYGKISELSTANRNWVKNLPEIQINQKNINIVSAYEKNKKIETEGLVEKIEQLVKKDDIRIAQENAINEEKRKKEEERLALEAKKKEEERLAQEAKKKEEERLALQKKLEEQRLIEQKKKEEEERLAQEAKRKEEERLALQKKLEEQRLIEQKKKEEEERLAQEAKRKEQERIAADLKRREEEKRALEEKKKEEERLAQEAKRKEEERLAQEAKRKEEERLAQEAKRKEEERKAQEAKRREEERLAFEAKKKEEERLALEAKRKEEQRLKEIQQKKALQEQQRKNQEIVKNSKNDMVLVEAGFFKLGGIEQNKVTLNRFMISKTEVTQDLYQIVMGDNPSTFKGEKNPVESLSWYDTIVFCNKLSLLLDLTPCYSVDGEIDPDKWNYTCQKGQVISKQIVCNFLASGFRLPTEAEWEYAARGGDKNSKFRFSGANKSIDVARYNINSLNKTGEVAQKKPNSLELYDMSGNVWEWCWDWYANYQVKAQTNPTGPKTGNAKCIRGGSYCRGEAESQIVYRELNTPESGSAEIGFRLVRSVE